MDPNPGPVLRRRQAGIRLRQLREAAGKSLGDVASYLDCSAAKISRIETGRLRARIPDVRNMLDLYNVPEPQQAEIIDLVRESREKGWWHAYSDISTEGLDTFLGLEDSAAQIWQYESYLIPGLLQTREYAYAVQAPRLDVSEDTAERVIEVKMTRQAILHRAQPPELNLVLDECVLHRLMALGPTLGQRQLDHLIEASRLPSVTLRIFPYSAGLGASNGVPFTIFSFPDPADPKVVYLDGYLGSSFESKIESVAQYTLAYDGLRSRALSPAESISFITALATRNHRPADPPD